MICTGFYEKATELEALKLDQSREEKDRFLRSLKLELERQATEKGIALKVPEHRKDK